MIHAINLLQRVWDSRGQLCVVDQVLQWVTAAELVQQAGQVTDDGRWIRCVDIPWYVPNLHQRKVPVGIRPLGCWDLQGNVISVGNCAPSMQTLPPLSRGGPSAPASSILMRRTNPQLNPSVSEDGPSRNCCASERVHSREVAHPKRDSL